MQYNFTGASSTGKSVVLNLMREHLPNYEFKTEVVRDLIKEKGININEQGDRKGQELIFMAYLDFLILNYDKSYASDRCIIDPICYTTMGVEDGKISKEVLDYQWDILKTTVKNGYLKRVYYFPIEFANVNDGVRSTDEGYRHRTDKIIKSILDDLIRIYPDKFEYITVHGTPDERIEQILNS